MTNNIRFKKAMLDKLQWDTYFYFTYIQMIFWKIYID